MRIEVARWLLIWSAVSASLLAGCGSVEVARNDAPERSAAEAVGAPVPATARLDLSKRRVELATGLTMSYVEAGGPAGEPVVLLHGVTDTGRSFFPTIEALVAAGAGLRVYALDQRGHGSSDMPPEAACAARPERCFGPDDLAADVIAFMDRLSIPAATIVGHSMGSIVAQEVALTYRERVRKLVLVGSFVDGASNAAIRDFLIGSLLEGMWRPALERRSGFRWPDDAYRLTPLDADPEVEAWMRENWVADPTADPGFLEEILPETARTPLGTWIGAIRALAATDNRERLAQLTVPTLVLWATQDGFFPEPDQVALRGALDTAVEACRTEFFYKIYGKAPLPGSGLQESDLGHNTQWGAPEAVAADIIAFVRSSRPTADLPYADPANVRRILVAPGAAPILERKPPPACAGASSGSA